MTYRYRTDENCPTIGQAMARHDRLMKGLKIALAVVIILLSATMVAYHATAAQTSEWQVVLTRGTSGTYVNTAKGSTAEAALQACHGLVPTNATTRTQYTCNPPRRVYIVTADPTCPALPAPRTQACPTGTTGTWQQTATMSAPPACTVTWSPSAPSITQCVAITPPTPTDPPVDPANAMTFNWTHDGLNLTEYRVVYWLHGGIAKEAIVPPDRRTYVTPTLTPGTWYGFVRAANCTSATACSYSADSRTLQKVIR